MSNSPALDPVDRQAVLDVLIAYSWAIDTGDAAGVAALFTPDGQFRGSGGTAAKGREELEAFAARVHNSRPHRLQHVTSNHEVEILDSATVQVRSYVQIFAAPSSGPHLLGMGAYSDRLAKVGDDWRFVSREFQSWGVAPQ